MTSIAPTLQGFFTERLISQRCVSPATIASYRDSLKLLLTFAQQHIGKKPSTLDWTDLDAGMITAFLDHLETQRHNTTRTRSLRLTAIRSLFTYAALRHPEHAALIQQPWARAARTGPSPSPPPPQAVLRVWKTERAGLPGQPLFPAPHRDHA